VYDVRVLDPEPGESTRAAGLAWFLAIGATLLDGAPGDATVGERVKVAIFATNADEPLKDWLEYPGDARLLKDKIASDLDEMDAETFAVERSLPPRSEGDA
jgi:hypothetical protein